MKAKLSSFLTIGCIAATSLFTCCQDASVMNGTKVVEKPTQPVSTTAKANIVLDYYNGFYTTSDILDFNHNDTIQILGWASEISKNTDLSKVLLQVGDKYIAANYGSERADVQTAIGCDSKSLGFEFTFTKDVMKDKNGMSTNQIRFIGITKDNEQCEPITFQLLKEPQIPSSLPFHEINMTTAGGGYCMDSYTTDNNVINLAGINTPNVLFSGWAFCSEEMSSFSNMYVRFGNHVIEATFNERNDVQALFNLPNNMVGFSFSIPSHLLINNNSLLVETIELFGVSTNGDFITTPKTYTLTIQ